jgi:hypothetical protein
MEKEKGRILNTMQFASDDRKQEGGAMRQSSI